MRVLLFVAMLTAPLAAELLETEIAFQGTGCVTCAESLQPRLERVRGVEKVELDLDKSNIKVKLEAGNKARIGPLRLRVTQDGTKILSMSVVVQGMAFEKDGAWIFTVRGLNETVGLETAPGVQVEAGRAYRLSGPIEESPDGDLTLRAESAQPIPQP